MRPFAALLAVVLLAGTAQAFVGGSASDAPPYRPNELLLKLERHPDELGGNVASWLQGHPVVRSYDVTVIEAEVILDEFPTLQDKDFERIVHLHYAGGVDAAALAPALQGSPGVTWAEVNHHRQWDAIPNDPEFPQQHYLFNTNPQHLRRDIHAPEAWDLERGSPRVIVGVIDSGIDFGHDEFDGRIWRNLDDVPGNGFDDDLNGFVDDFYGWDFSTGRNYPFDSFGHGTHVSGILGATANNAIGIAGIDSFCQIMPVKVGNIAGLFNDRAVRGILYAIANGAKIVNNSWGGREYANILAELARYADSRGVLVIASAGNNNTVLPHYPGALPEVVGVASVDSADRRSVWDEPFATNFGPWVDIAAPGTAILSTWPGDGYRAMNGTSMAAPVVTGVASLLMARFPGICCQELKGRLLASTDPIDALNPQFVGELGTGRINALTALTTTPGPSLQIREFRIREVSGNLNGRIEPDETFDLQVVLENSWRDARDINLSLSIAHPEIAVVAGNWQIPDLPGTSRIASPDGQFRFATSAALPGDSTATLRVTISAPLHRLRRVQDHDLDLFPITPDQPGWPVSLDGDPRAALAVADLDGNGTQEVIAAGHNGIVNVYEADGTVRTGWPQYAGQRSIGSPAVADLDGDGLLEIGVGALDDRVYIWRADGTPLPGWPQMSGGHGAPTAITFTDVDGDGDREVIDTTWEGDVYVWHHDGTSLPGWPKAVDGSGFNTSAAVGPLLGDGRAMIVVAAKSGTVYAVDPLGNALPGWPQVTGDQVLSAPAMADIDADGDLEIVLGCDDGRLYAWHHHGGAAAGWPVDLGSEITAAPAIADLTGSGTLEVAILDDSGTLHVLDAAGKPLPGFPLPTGLSVNGSVLIGDVTGDGLPEIVFTADRFVAAVTPGGQLVDGWPVAAVNTLQGTPVLADLDGDGDVEVATGSRSYEVLATDTIGRIGGLRWGSFQGDGGNTGFLPPAPGPRILLAGVVPTSLGGPYLFAQTSTDTVLVGAELTSGAIVSLNRLGPDWWTLPPLPEVVGIADIRHLFARSALSSRVARWPEFVVHDADGLAEHPFDTLTLSRGDVDLDGIVGFGYGPALWDEVSLGQIVVTAITYGGVQPRLTYGGAALNVPFVETLSSPNVVLLQAILDIENTIPPGAYPLGVAP